MFQFEREEEDIFGLGDLLATSRKEKEPSSSKRRSDADYEHGSSKRSKK